jgi:DNA topoisomerase IA
LPDLKSGDEVEVQNLMLREGKTEPPDYLTESELITLMEKVCSG